MSLLTWLAFAAGLVLLVLGAELLVRGASRLAAAAGISPLVIGLTVVAFGTSAPELSVSLGAAWHGQTDMALGNVVGSNIFNVLCILGVSALVAPLVVSAQLVRLDVPVMIAVSGGMWLLALDGSIGRVDGALLSAGAIGYTWLLIVLGRRSEMGAPQQSGGADHRPSRGGLLVQLVLVLAGLALLVLGSRWLVNGAVAIAQALGVSELVIGLTIVAAGTSLPELATSVLAAVRGQRDIAVGNIVGSNIFNILMILGLTGLLAPGGVAVTDAARGFDIPVMTAVAVACLPIFFTGHTIARWEGGLFLFYYLAYTVYLLLSQTGHAAAPALRIAILWFVLPLTAVTLLVLAWRALVRRA